MILEFQKWATHSQAFLLVQFAGRSGKCEAEMVSGTVRRSSRVVLEGGRMANGMWAKEGGGSGNAAKSAEAMDGTVYRES